LTLIYADERRFTPPVMLAQASIQFVTGPERRKLDSVQEFSGLRAVRE
jgi:hypothetical protein